MKLRNMNATLASLVFLAVGNLALAQGVAAVDVSDATESLTNQIPSMTTILTTVLGLTALVMAFRWIKRTMGG